MVEQELHHTHDNFVQYTGPSEWRQPDGRRQFKGFLHQHLSDIGLHGAAGCRRTLYTIWICHWTLLHFMKDNFSPEMRAA